MSFNSTQISGPAILSVPESSIEAKRRGLQTKNLKKRNRIDLLIRFFDKVSHPLQRSGLDFGEDFQMGLSKRLKRTPLSIVIRKNAPPYIKISYPSSTKDLSLPPHSYQFV